MRPSMRFSTARGRDIYGAKLAGAGGGGFLMLLARDAEAAAALRAALSQEFPGRGAFVPYRIAEEGLRIQTSGRKPVSGISDRVG